MKKIFKKTLSALICAASICAGATFFSNFCHAKNPTEKTETETETEKEEKSEGFGFIKSEEKISDLIYDGTVLLYGGIALISISAAGMIFTFLPKRRKNR